MNYSEYLDIVNYGSVSFVDRPKEVTDFLDFCQARVLECLEGAKLPTGDEGLYQSELSMRPVNDEDDELRARILSWAPGLDKLDSNPSVGGDVAMWVRNINHIFINHCA